MEPFGVSSDLTGAVYDIVSGLWDGLEREFALRAAKAAVHPRVTYRVGAGRQPNRAAKKVCENAEDIAPFPVELHGVGVFSRRIARRFLRARKDEPLLRANRPLLTAMTSAACSRRLTTCPTCGSPRHPCTPRSREPASTGNLRWLDAGALT